MEFQPHTAVKTEPYLTGFVCTLRVIHDPPPPAN